MPQIIKLRGTGLLKVVSIILIIFGAIGLVFGAISMFSGQATASLLGLDETGTRVLTLIGMVALASGAVELIFGIIGVRCARRAEKANLLITLGIIMIIVAVFSILYTNVLNATLSDFYANLENTMAQDGVSIDLTGAASTAFSPFTLLDFILPVLYIIGALLNKLTPATPSSHHAGSPKWMDENSQNQDGPEIGKVQIQDEEENPVVQDENPPPASDEAGQAVVGEAADDTNSQP